MGYLKWLLPTAGAVILGLVAISARVDAGRERTPDELHATVRTPPADGSINDKTRSLHPSASPLAWGDRTSRALAAADDWNEPPRQMRAPPPAEGSAEPDALARECMFRAAIIGRQQYVGSLEDAAQARQDCLSEWGRRRDEAGRGSISGARAPARP